jgi:hypothetical protein
VGYPSSPRAWPRAFAIAARARSSHASYMTDSITTPPRRESEEQRLRSENHPASGELLSGLLAPPPNQRNKCRGRGGWVRRSTMRILPPARYVRVGPVANLPVSNANSLVSIWGLPPRRGGACGILHGGKTETLTATARTHE